MEAKAAKKERNPRRGKLGKMGICVACTSLAICRYPKSIQHPVMFCEEFNASRTNARKKEISVEPVLVTAPVQVTMNRENFSSNYIGLCKRCDKLYACRLTNPAGALGCASFLKKEKRPSDCSVVSQKYHE